MESLRHKRKALKGSLTRLQTAIDSYTENVNAGLVESHSFRLNEIWNDLNINHFAILDLCKSQAEFEAQQGDFDANESRVIEMRAKLFSFSRSQAPANPMRNSSFSFHSEPKPQDVRLPKLDLPTFSGSIQDWMSFHDLFSATIHNNQSLMPAQKLQYLKLSLRGDAARILQSMKVTDGNYAIAWELLTNRYENRRELVFAHIKRLTMQNNLQSESASGLRELVDTTNECMRTLETLEQPTQHWDSIVTFLILQKLDPETRRLWELSLPNNDVPSFKSLIEWLEQHAQALNSIACTKTKVQPKPNFKPEVKVNAKAHHATSENKANNKCSVCDGNHPYFKCSTLLAKSVTDRMKLVKERKLCLNCLRPNHFVSQCTSESSCKQCGEKHHSFLHFDRSAIKSPEPTQTVVSAHVANNNQSQVLLATAMVLVQDTYGNLQQCRALLDPGSQASFVTKSCVQRLKLQRHHVDVDISGLAATEIANARHYTNLHIVSNVNACFTFNVEAYNLARVTGMLPNLPCDSAPWHHVTTLQLADPIFNQPGHVDILLGADVVSDVMLGEVRHGPENSPIAQDTKLGWILYGRAASQTASTKPASSLFSCITQLSLDKSLQRFWQLEDLPMKRLLTAEEQTCEGKFSLTHTRNSDGRYVVRLPFKPGVSLGNSYNMALRRFKSVECKLEANPEIKLQYHKFMQDYLDLGHMQRVPPSYPQKRDCEKFYLPHHCVFKASSTTTKLRVVFDGSARSTSGNSLNDMLMVGPVIQDDLVSILLRFRLHLIALIADVVKMYRQVLINSDHIDYQRILWRFSPCKPIEEFQLLTVTYGTASAPYLATKALLQLADDEQHSFPIASEITKRDRFLCG